MLLLHGMILGLSNMFFCGLISIKNGGGIDSFHRLIKYFYLLATLLSEVEIAVILNVSFQIEVVEDAA